MQYAKKTVWHSDVFPLYIVKFGLIYYVLYFIKVLFSSKHSK